MRGWLTWRDSAGVEVQAARESSSMRGAVPGVMERSKDEKARVREWRRWTEMGRRWLWVVVACAASGGGLTVLVPAQGCCGNGCVARGRLGRKDWGLVIELLGSIEERSGSMFTYSRLPWPVDCDW